MEFLPALKHLRLDAPGCETEFLLASLRMVTALSALRIGECTDAEVVVGALAHLPNLAHLHLDEIEADESFLMALHRVSSLASLRLDRVVGQHGARALARLMQYRPLAVVLDTFEACQAREFVRTLHLPSGSSLGVGNRLLGEVLVVELFRSHLVFLCTAVPGDDVGGVLRMVQFL
jgi:hypothetical protein